MTKFNLLSRSEKAKSRNPAPKAPAPPPAPDRKARAKVAKAVRRTRDESAFLAAALEVIETPPSPTARITALTICLIVTVSIIWASLAELDMVAVAEGHVIQIGHSKVIQPLETAAIKSIPVQDGDHVEKGQTLVELDPVDVESDLNQLLYDHDQAILDAESARLLMLKDPTASFSVPQTIDPARVEAARQRTINEIEKLAAQEAASQAEIARQRAALDSAKVEMQKTRETLPLLREKYNMAMALYDKKFGTRMPVIDANQQVIEKEASLHAMESKNQEVESGIHNLIGKLEETRANYMIDAADRRTKALQKVAELEQQIIKTRQRVSYRLLTSPVSGTVQSIKIHTKGAVVTSADTLMTIVPDDGGLEIEALIGNSDIGFVRDGQPVELKFQAFPFTRYGLVAGTIKSIGRDAATPQQIAGITGNPNATPPAYDLSYPARIAMAKTAVATEHRLEPIQPGMRVSVEIRTGSRSVMSYLLSPLIKTVKEAARER